MTRNNNRSLDKDDKLSPGYDADPMDNTQRREPRFSSYDDDDEYEEPDRDTDYPAGFRGDSVEEEFEDEFHDDDALDQLPDTDSALSYAPDLSADEDPDAWLEDEAYQADEDSEPKWPLSLIAVAVVALVLLAAGGYGIMQQRATTEAELRDLRAALATTARPENINASRDALQNLQQSYDQLSANAEALTLENRRLTDTVAGLQAQLGVQQGMQQGMQPEVQPGEQQAALTKTPSGGDTVRPAATAEVPAAQPATPEPVTPKPVTPKPVIAQPAPPKPAAAIPAPTNSVATTAATGPWFVNFGSYASRNMAQSWASKLRPLAGKVIIAPLTKDSQTLYRVRVVGLASKNSAQDVARQMETQMGVSALWVGKE